MKKNLWFVVALICSVCTFTACGDDEEEVKTSVADEIAGVYDGTLDVFIVSEQGDLPVATNMAKDVTITKKDDTTIDMELKDLSIALAPGGTPITIGDIKMENCPVTGTAADCRFANTADIAVPMVGICNVALTATIVNGKLDMPIVVVATEMGGLNVKVNYKGTKK